MKRFLVLISGCLAAGTTHASAQLSPPVSPSGLTVSAATLIRDPDPPDSPYWTALFEWQDNSGNEDGFLFLKKTGPTSYTPIWSLDLNPNSRSITLSGFVPGSSYALALISYRGDGTTLYYDDIIDFPVFRAPDYFVKTWFGGTAGQPLQDAAIEMSGPEYVVAVSAGNMPAWMSFEEETGTFHGTPPAAGVYTASVAVTYDDGFVLNGTATVRVVPAASGPVESSPLPSPVLTAGGVASVVELDSHFTDPDVTQAVRMTTTKGSIDIILQSQAAPQTVANFLTYVNGTGAAGYDGSVVHRSVPGFVIQGGGFKPAGGLDFSVVTDLAPVVNEPGLPNLRGTLSMAKIGGNPNSATNEWFVNLGDNTANLDYQNEGFAVFARVAGTGMGAADAIAALPRGNYKDPASGVTIGGASAGSVFSECPMDAATAPAAMDQSKLVRVLTVRTVAPLAYQVLSNSNPAVVTASVTGNSLQLTPAANAGGTAEVVVQATDLDGKTQQSTLQVTVRWTFAAWALSNNLGAGVDGPADDPERDGCENRLEYGLLTSPTAGGWSGVSAGRTVSGEGAHAALTFPLRKHAADLVYRVQRSGSLREGSWTEVWNSSQGFAHPRVVAAVEQADRTVVTVRDTVSNPAAAFLRVVVE